MNTSAKLDAIADACEALNARMDALVVARRMKGGKIKYGKPGQIHSDLHVGEPEPHEADMGFAKPGGKFMGREEAMSWVRRKQPKISKHDIAFDQGSPYHPFYKPTPPRLEASRYNLAVKKVKKGL
jgi:hypothetical protein